MWRIDTLVAEHVVVSRYRQQRVMKTIIFINIIFSLLSGFAYSQGPQFSYVCVCNNEPNPIPITPAFGAVGTQDFFKAGSCENYMQHYSYNDTTLIIIEDTPYTFKYILGQSIYYGDCDELGSKMTHPLLLYNYYYTKTYWLTADDNTTMPEAEHKCKLFVDGELAMFENEEEINSFFNYYKYIAIRPPSKHFWTSGIRKKGAWYWNNTDIEVHATIDDNYKTGYDCLSVKLIPSPVVGEFYTRFMSANCENKRISYFCQIRKSFLDSVIPPRISYSSHILHYACSCNALTTPLDLQVTSLSSVNANGSHTLIPGECLPYMKTILSGGVHNQKVFVNLNEVYYSVDADPEVDLKPLQLCQTYDINVSAFMVTPPDIRLLYWVTIKDNLTRYEAMQWCNTNLNIDLLIFGTLDEFGKFISRYEKIRTKPQSEHVWTNGLKVNGVWRWGNTTMNIELPIDDTGPKAGDCLAFNTKTIRLIAMNCNEPISYICSVDYIAYMNNLLFPTTTKHTPTTTTPTTTTPTTTTPTITTPTTTKHTPTTTTPTTTTPTITTPTTTNYTPTTTTPTTILTPTTTTPTNTYTSTTTPTSTTPTTPYTSTTTPTSTTPTTTTLTTTTKTPTSTTTLTTTTKISTSTTPTTTTLTTTTKTTTSTKTPISTSTTTPTSTKTHTSTTPTNTSTSTTTPTATTPTATTPTTTIPTTTIPTPTMTTPATILTPTRTTTSPTTLTSTTPTTTMLTPTTTSKSSTTPTTASTSTTTPTITITTPTTTFTSTTTPTAMTAITTTLTTTMTTPTTTTTITTSTSKTTNATTPISKVATSPKTMNSSSRPNKSRFLIQITDETTEVNSYESISVPFISSSGKHLGNNVFIIIIHLLLIWTVVYR